MTLALCGGAGQFVEESHSKEVEGSWISKEGKSLVCAFGKQSEGIGVILNLAQPL